MVATEQRSEASVWWGGASISALKGIPQGLLLGAIGFALLTGLIFSIGALGGGTLLVNTFGSFLFGNATAAAAAASGGNIVAFVGALNPLTFVALNTVLTAVGNFLTGGDLAVAQHRQQVDHEHNNQRIRAIEGRELKVEQTLEHVVKREAKIDQAIQMVAQHSEQLDHKFTKHISDHPVATTETPRHVQKILEEGPKVKVEKEASASHAADVVADRLEDAERAIG